MSRAALGHGVPAALSLSSPRWLLLTDLGFALGTPVLVLLFQMPVTHRSSFRGLQLLLLEAFEP